MRETASTQIKNAQEVRLEISGYYFSVFANQSQATREVNCFVDAVIKRYDYGKRCRIYYYE